MIPQKITLKNFHGIRAGLNREEITIDLTGDHQVVAIRGDNGSGKSTILNWGLHPYRDPPGAGSVYDACGGPDAARELEFLHVGILYRATITIKQTAKSRSMTAVLLFQGSQGWQPVTMPDGTVSDGKNSTYDSIVEHLLGPAEIYFLTAFQAQGAARISEYGDPKGLLGQLLHLEEVDVDAGLARDKSRDARRQWESLKASMDRVSQLELSIQETTVRLAGLEANHEAVSAAMAAAETELMSSNTALQAAMASTGENVAIRQQLESLEKRKAELIEEMTKAKGRFNDALHSEQRQADRSIGEIRRQISRQEGDIRSAKEKISRAVVAMEHLETVARAEAKLPEFNKDLDALLAEMERRKQQKDVYLKAKQESLLLLGKIKTLGADLRGLERECATLRNQAGFVGDVPCRGEFPYDDCPALQAAIKASKELPAREGLIPKGQQAMDGASLEQQDAEQRATSIGDQTEAIHQLEREINAKRDVISKAEKWAARRGEVEGAKDAKERDETSIVECQQEISLLQQKEDAVRHEAAEKERSLKGEHDDAVAMIQARAAAVLAEIAALPPLGLEDALTAAREQQKINWNLAKQVAKTHNDHLAAMSTAQARIDDATRELTGLASVREQATRLEEEAAGWNLLVTGLKGVIDLVIEDAGPTIAAIANQLLTVAYGPRFSIRIVTQKKQQNGAMVETFDISVLDSVTGMEGSISKKSGGQQVWLNMALAYAVAIYLRDASGVDYETMIGDEVDDGLTGERKEQFYRMDREAMRLGGYTRRIFVSHHPAAWELADLVVDLDQLRMGG